MKEIKVNIEPANKVQLDLFENDIVDYNIKSMLELIEEAFKKCKDKNPDFIVINRSFIKDCGDDIIVLGDSDELKTLDLFLSDSIDTFAFGQYNFIQ